VPGIGGVQPAQTRAFCGSEKIEGYTRTGNEHSQCRRTIRNNQEEILQKKTGNKQ
jgi:hypothetical protein